MEDIAIVTATGSAATDTANLQTAIDSMCFKSTSPTDIRFGTVVLRSGAAKTGFNISSPLIVNGRSNHSAYTVPLIYGLGMPRIRYTGAPVDSPILSIYGIPPQGRTNLVESVIFHCNNLCRGPLFYSQRHTSLYNCIHLIDSVRVGCDFIDCWGSTIKSMKIFGANGIAARFHRWNSSSSFHMRIDRATATEWPDELDESVLDGAGNYVRTSASQRAAVVIQGNDNQHFQTVFEQSTLGAYPLLHYRGFCSRFGGFRLENNSYSESTVVVDGIERDDGQFVVFENVRGKDHQKDGDGGKKSFLELRGDTYGVTVRDSTLWGFGTAIVRATSGDHYGIQVQNCNVKHDNDIPDIVMEGSPLPTHTVELPVAAP